MTVYPRIWYCCYLKEFTFNIKYEKEMTMKEFREYQRQYLIPESLKNNPQSPMNNVIILKCTWCSLIRIF